MCHFSFSCSSHLFTFYTILLKLFFLFSPKAEVNKKLTGIETSMQHLRDSRSIIQDAMQSHIQEILNAVRETKEIKPPIENGYLRMRAEVLIDLHKERQHYLTEKHLNYVNNRRSSLQQSLEARRSGNRLSGRRVGRNFCYFLRSICQKFV